MMHPRHLLDKEIVPVKIIAKEFDRQSKLSLLTFAARFLNNNESKRHLVSRSNIELYWKVEVMSQYRQDCLKREHLLGQVLSHISLLLSCI